MQWPLPHNHQHGGWSESPPSTIDFEEKQVGTRLHCPAYVKGAAMCPAGRGFPCARIGIGLSSRRLRIARRCCTLSGAQSGVLIRRSGTPVAEKNLDFELRWRANSGELTKSIWFEKIYRISVGITRRGEGIYIDRFSWARWEETKRSNQGFDFRETEFSTNSFWFDSIR
jgi:hypothetical protein